MYENIIMTSEQIKGILKISDPNTGEVFIQQENAFHSPPHGIAKPSVDYLFLSSETEYL